MEALDNVRAVASDPSEQDRRGRTVPVYEWWPAAVKRELKARGMTQRHLALHFDVPDSTITRLLSLETPTLGLLIAVSDLLKLPYPVMLPETEAIALDLAKQHRLLKRDVQIDEIAAGVTGKSVDSQPVAVQPEHGIRQRKRATKGKPRVRLG